MKQHRNVRVWYLTTFLSEASYTLPIWYLFNTQFLRLNNTQAFILGVLPFGLSALFEVPTGSWADKYGRARIYRIGVLLLSLTFFSYLFTKNLNLLIAFSVFGALGNAMSSGSAEALVHDSMNMSNKNENYSKVHGRRMASLYANRVLTVVGGGFLFAINPKLPYFAMALSLSLAFAVSFLFVEVRLEDESELTNTKHIIETLKLILSKTYLIKVLGLLLVYRWLSEALFSLYQPYFKSINIPANRFGILFSIISLLSGLGALLISKFIKRYNIFTILLVMIMTIIFTSAGMLIRSSDLIYLLIIPSSIIFGISKTIEQTSIQSTISSRYQATALSLASLTQTGIFLATVTIIGISLDKTSVHNTNIYLTISLLISCIPFIYLALKRNEIKK